MRFLAKVLARLFSAIALLAMIVTFVFTATFVVLLFSGNDRTDDPRLIRFILWGVAGIAASSTAAWLASRILRGFDTHVFRYREASPRTASRALYVSYSILAAAGAFLIFQKTNGGMIEKALLVAAAVVATWLGFHLVIFLHELGHLLFGWLFRLELQKIQIGVGRLLLRRKMRSGFIWEWRWTPSGGLVIGWPADNSLAEVRRWFFIAGGPLAGIGTVAIFFVLFGHDPLKATGKSWKFVFDLAGGVVLLFAVGVTLGNLVPFTSSFSGGPSDGYQLFKTPFLLRVRPVERKWSIRWSQISFFWTSSQPKRAWSLLGEAMERDTDLRDRLEFAKAWLHFYDEDFPAAVASFESVLAKESLPEQLRLSARAYLACCFAATGRLDEARPVMESVLQGAPSGLKAIYLDLFASMPFMYEIHVWRNEAKQWIAEAIQLSPNLTPLRATETSLLIESGELERGAKGLRDVIWGNFSEIDQGTAAFYLALILKRRGAPEPKIARWRKRAVEWCPQPWLLRRIENELGAEACCSSPADQIA